MIKKLLLIICFSFSIHTFAEQKIDYEKYLASFDMLWEVLPTQWNEGAFVGNGQLGLMFYVDTTANKLVFKVGRQDVTDHRLAPNKKTSRGVKGAGVHYDFNRLDVGQMQLVLNSKILSGTARVDIWNAELSIQVKTAAEAISIKAYTPYKQMVQVVEVSTSSDTKSYYWEFIPGYPQSARTFVRPNEERSKTYEKNPDPIVYVTENKSEGACVQALLAGGDYATYWEEVASKSGSTLFISTANNVPESGISFGVAKQSVKSAIKEGAAKCNANMRNHWHSFYQKSFLSIPDKQLEAFYWAQLYKLGACVRPDGPVLDLMGPFYKHSSWLGVWWNLNVELTYWPTYASNHLELGESYINAIDEYFELILSNLGSKKESANNPLLSGAKTSKIGDYAWALHNYYLQYRYAGDKESIRKKWLPLTKKVYAIYTSHFSEKDGIIHLQNVESPEYEGFKIYNNANYNLMLLRWLLSTMVEYADNSNTTEVAEWKNVLNKLHPYPIDSNGLMIASNVPLAKSHRHYSHLLGLYPLFVMNPDNPQDMELARRSVAHWHSVDNGKQLAGYSYTGAASLFAALGQGNEAHAQLQHFLNKPIGISELLPNTMYVESGATNPCIETPLSAASAAIELLLQSWGGKVRVFPAMPSDWKEAQFANLRAQGAFLVSANYTNGKTAWLRIKSEAGEPCIIKVPEWQEAHIVGGKKIRIKSLGNGEFALSLSKGDYVELAPTKNLQMPVFKNVDKNSSATKNFYGVKQGQSFKYREHKVPVYSWHVEPL